MHLFKEKKAIMKRKNPSEFYAMMFIDNFDQDVLAGSLTFIGHSQPKQALCFYESPFCFANRYFPHRCSHFARKQSILRHTRRQ